MIKADDYLSKMGKRIRALRKGKSLTQTEFARLVGSNRCTISQIEIGKQNLTLNMLRSISRNLGVDVRDLIPEGV